MTWEHDDKDYMMELDMLAAIQRMQDAAKRQYWVGFRMGFFIGLFGALTGLILGKVF